jgi:preprotein translocase subunit SecG
LAVADKKKEVPLAGATAPSYTEAVVNAMVNAALNGVESLVEEESSDKGSSSKGSDSSKESLSRMGMKKILKVTPMIVAIMTMITSLMIFWLET